MVVSLAIISPTGTFPLLILAAICAAIPALFGAKCTRVVSLILLGISLALIRNYYPDFQHEYENYRRRGQERAALSTTAPVMQGAVLKKGSQL